MKIDIKCLENSTYKLDVSHFKVPDAKGTLFVFPGAGYNYMGPCLYYPSNLFLEAGYDLVNFEYDFRRTKPDHYGEFYTFLMEYSSQCNGPFYAMAKSIGTRILAAAAEELPFEKMIWLTPGYNSEEVHDGIMAAAAKSFVSIGTKDQLYNADYMDEEKQAGAQLLELKDTEHGMDVDGDVFASIENMNLLVKSIQEFVGF